MVNTVAEKKSHNTNEDYATAKQACKTQIKIGWLSVWDFIWIVTGNLLPNWPITKQDILSAKDIFGPDVGSLKGKTTHRAPPTV